MQMHNNKGGVVAEQNVTISNEGVLITNTMYDGGRAVQQTITVRDDNGQVRTTGVFGKILP